MRHIDRVLFWIAVFLVGGFCLSRPAIAADPATIQAASETFVQAFNDAKPDEIVSLFLPQGELIDDAGNIYKGKEELQNLFTQYFAKFPDAKLSLSIESIRLIGDDIAIEEGTRYVTTKDDASAQMRYVAVRTWRDGKWYFASVQEFNDEPVPTSGERLAALSWLEGDWVSEGAESAIKISYRWADDGNFLLGDFLATRAGEVVMKSTHRLAWDPFTQNVRSWLFESDGGHAEGTWTQIDDAWIVKSSATFPDATIGSATVTITRQGENQFTMVGTERTIAGGRLDDFDITVTRAPPMPATAASEDASVNTEVK